MITKTRNRAQTERDDAQGKMSNLETELQQAKNNITELKTDLSNKQNSLTEVQRKVQNLQNQKDWCERTHQNMGIGQEVDKYTRESFEKRISELEDRNFKLEQERQPVVVYNREINAMEYIGQPVALDS